MSEYNLARICVQLCSNLNLPSFGPKSILSSIYLYKYAKFCHNDLEVVTSPTAPLRILELGMGRDIESSQGICRVVALQMPEYQSFMVKTIV
jgi:hypothetical protein